MTEPGVKRVMVLPTVMLPLVGADVSVGKAYVYNEQILNLLAFKVAETYLDWQSWVS